MSISSLLTTPWAIEPQALQMIETVAARHFRGERADLAQIEAQLGRPLANNQAGYTLHGGVALLQVQGAIAPKANMLTRVSGGTSADLLRQSVVEAGQDPKVKSLILAIDSPGGSVHGIPELAAAIAEVSRLKPVIAVSDAIMASAAYWLGSAARKIYVTGPTVMVGSIGVVARHVDVSGAESLAGTKTTEITAGKYKRIASSHEPLTTEGRASLQDQVDHLYSVFVEAVAEHRGVSVNTVLKKMADGRMFIGSQAIAAGLVDGIASLDQLIAGLQSNPAQYGPARRTGAVAATAAQQVSTPAQAAASNQLNDIYARLNGGSVKAAAQPALARSQTARPTPTHDTAYAALNGGRTPARKA